MEWFERLRRAAEEAVERASKGAERGARYVAEHGPGVIGETAGEFLAEREYHRARGLAAGGVDRDNARQVLELLLPYWNADGHHAVLINQLIGQAYTALGDFDAATEHLREALAQVRDVAARRNAEAVWLKERGILGDDSEAEVLTDLATLALETDDPDRCVRYAMEAIDLDPKHYEAYRLQTIAMLRRGIDSEVAAEILMRALTEGAESGAVLGWVRELMPEHLVWFERVAE